MLSVFLSLYLSLLALGQAKPVDPTSALTRSVGGVSRSLFLSLTERSDPSSENVVISPVSVWLALAMLHQGAAGTTRRELEKFLELQGPAGSRLDTGALLQDYAERRAELNTTIELANIMFADRSLQVREEYQHGLTTSLKRESFEILHNKRHLVSMANTGPHSNGSQFFINTVKTSWLDGKNVVFGKVLVGSDVVDSIEQLGTNSGLPKGEIVIVDCGEL